MTSRDVDMLYAELVELRRRVDRLSWILAALVAAVGGTEIASQVL
jgi:hypothetical protein